eukprot:1158355-Pelagomonas_calceolata.AAC.3
MNIKVCQERRVQCENLLPWLSLKTPMRHERWKMREKHGERIGLKQVLTEVEFSPFAYFGLAAAAAAAAVVPAAHKVTPEKRSQALPSRHSSQPQGTLLWPRLLISNSAAAAGAATFMAPHMSQASHEGEGERVRLAQGANGRFDLSSFGLGRENTPFLRNQTV